MTSTPAVIFGLDGADVNLILRWVEEGYLPNIAAIMRDGWYAKLSGDELMLEHGIWMSLMSGCSRNEHGYHYFRQLRKNSYEIENVTSKDVDVQPFWSTFKGTEKSVAIVDIPDVQPVIGINGIQLIDWAIHDPLDPPVSEPPELLDKVREIFGPQINVFENPDKTDKDQQIYKQLLDRVSRKGGLTRELIKDEKFDLIAVAFGECHTIGHQFWQYLLDGPRQGTPEHFTNAVRTFYAAIDREIGSIIEQIGKSNVFVVAPVGIETHYPTGGLIEDFLNKLGYQVPSAAPKTTGQLIASKRNSMPSLMSIVRSLVPESWRIAVSRYFPRHVREKLLSDQFVARTNWEKTTAFCTPSSHASFIFVNLSERQPMGTVAPGAEYEDVLKRLESDLAQVIDPLTGASPFRSITRSSIFNEGAPPAVMPDIVVTWRSTNEFQEQLLHPKATITQKKPEYFRPNDHTPEGFIAAAGPNILRKGLSPDVDVLDLASLFLKTIGESEEMNNLEPAEKELSSVSR